MINYIKIIGLALIITLSSLQANAESRYASIIVDARTGRVIEGANTEALRHPASLTKIMTLYLTFKALRQGTLRINQALPVSAFAAAQSPSKLGLTAGSSLRVRDAILGLVTQSANDAAVVLAEALGGTESNFGRQMTAQARQLGMTRTVYRNASGLPDDDQVTTARDQAILARAIYFNFPEYYRYFSTPSFTYLGRTHKNHNHLMERYAGMDGIKTGFIRASGFNLVASAVRNKTRLIAVIFGGTSARSRDRDMAALLDGAFAKIARTSTQPAAPVAQAPASSPPAETSQGDAPDEETAEQRDDAPTTPPPVQAAPSPTPQTVAVPTPIAQTAPSTPAVDVVTMPPKNTAKPEAPPPPPAAPISPAPAKPQTGWITWLGSYKLRSSAEHAAKRAIQQLPQQQSNARYQIVAVSGKGKTLFRAQMTGLDKAVAQKLCHNLKRKKQSCQIVSATAG